MVCLSHTSWVVHKKMILLIMCVSWLMMLLLLWPVVAARTDAKPGCQDKCGNAISLGRESSPIELFVETHVRSQDRQKGVQQFIDSCAQHFMDTYNNRLRERYGDDLLTHPKFDLDLWMEAGLSGGSDKNQVYGLSNTTTDNLRSARSASTVRSSQSVSSSQSKEFVALQQHTALLTEKYDHLSETYTQLVEQQRAESEQQRAESERQRAAYEELRQMVMNMAQSGTCAPNPFWPHNSQPPPPLY